MIRSMPMLTVVALAGLASVGWAQAPAELEPRPVTFASEEVALEDVLRELQKQTGNMIADRRAAGANVKVKLPSKSGTFWKMLDAVGDATKVGLSARQPDGGVALVDRPYRVLKTHYSGIFRFAVKQVSVSRDDEAQVHLCQVLLDVAWEPRFKVLYLNLEPASATFGGKAQAIERDSAERVAGARCATEVPLSMKAPPRATLQIDSLKGHIRVVGVPKMLEFALPKLGKDKPVEQEGVKVRLTQVEQSRTRVSVDLLVEYPKDAIAALESFQTWRDNNRIWLTWTDGKTKKAHELEPTSGGGAEETPAGTKMQFHFTAKGDAVLPPPGAEVTLRYRTPSRVVAFTVPFEFQNLPLP